MSKPRKVDKVEEPAGTYGVTPKQSAPKPADPSTPEIRYIDPETFRKASEKIFATRKELFRRLAQ